MSITSSPRSVLWLLSAYLYILIIHSGLDYVKCISFYHKVLFKFCDSPQAW